MEKKEGVRTMVELNLPSFAVRLRDDVDGRRMIYDRLRRKYVVLTREEWVRQHFINFLIEDRGYPPTLLANEVSLRVGEKTVRADSVLYGGSQEARMLMEYKAPSVAISRKVVEQISAYNTLLRVDYIVVSNGLKHYCCRVDYEDRKLEYLADVPLYGEL